jgi:hypothetical protein
VRKIGPKEEKQVAKKRCGPNLWFIYGFFDS